MAFNSIIKRIHESELYGTIVECGNGCAIINALMNVEGASKTIYESKQPYSKEAQAQMYYELKTLRSVSKEFVVGVVKKEFCQNRQLAERFKLEKTKRNFALATSFQLQGGEAQTTNLTHGYIALAYKQETIKIYHVSIPIKQEREYYFDEISKIGLEILLAKAENRLPLSEFIDGVWDVIDAITNTPFIQNNSETLTILQKNRYDNFIVFNPKGELVRFEDFARDKPGMILLKGSFNPIHERHILMMKQTQEAYPDYATAFITSIHRYDKPDVTVNELEEKMKKITSLGYYFIVNKNLFFTGTLLNIRRRWTTPIILPIGADTLNRWIDAEIKERREWLEEEDNYNSAFTDEEVLTTPLKRDSRTEFWWIKKAGDFKFIVFDRIGSPEHKFADYFRKWFEWDTDAPKDDGISSTKIRKGEYKSQLS